MRTPCRGIARLRGATPRLSRFLIALLSGKANRQVPLIDHRLSASAFLSHKTGLVGPTAQRGDFGCFELRIGRLELARLVQGLPASNMTDSAIIPLLRNSCSRRLI